jgi:hypothetical protein
LLDTQTYSELAGKLKDVEEIGHLGFAQLVVRHHANPNKQLHPNKAQIDINEV